MVFTLFFQIQFKESRQFLCIYSYSYQSVFYFLDRGLGKDQVTFQFLSFGGLSLKEELKTLQYMDCKLKSNTRTLLQPVPALL